MGVSIPNKRKIRKKAWGRYSEQNTLHWKGMEWGSRFRTTEIAEKGKEGRDSEQKKIAGKCMGVAILNKYIQKNAWGVAISNRINCTERHVSSCFSIVQVSKAVYEYMGSFLTRLLSPEHLLLQPLVVTRVVCFISFLQFAPG